MTVKELAKGLGKTLVILLVFALIGLVILYFLQDLVVYGGRGGYRGESQEWQSRLAAVASRGYQLFDFEGPGGRRLKGVWTPASAGTAPAVLWLHGFGENITEVIPQMSALHDAGLHVFVLQYPGYGHSPGELRETAILADAEAFYDLLVKRDDVAGGRVLVGGEETGSTVAFLLATRRDVAGVIAVAPTPDLATEVRASALGLPVSLMMKDRYDGQAALPAIKCPVLFASGTLDDVVPPDQVEAMAAKITHRNVFTTIIAGAGHRDVIEIGGRPLIEAIQRFVGVAGK
jgi:pimeloyl-ACP methyl ester carboxylesterase